MELAPSGMQTIARALSFTIKAPAPAGPLLSGPGAHRVHAAARVYYTAWRSPAAAPTEAKTSRGTEVANPPYS